MLKNLLRENLLTPVPDVVYRLRAKRPLKYKKRMTMKKLWFLCILLLACTGVLYAQELRSYYNDKTGWEGKAYISYSGIQNDSEWATLINGINSHIRSIFDDEPVTKLSKKQIWLIQQALGEYDIADNEVYFISLGDPLDNLDLFVRIQNNGRSFKWTESFRIPWD